MTSDDEPVNAPERVWLAPDLGDDWSILKVGDAIYWEGVDRHHPDDCETEYVRADIAATRIRELEAELESKSRHLKNATTLRNSDFNELWREIKERDELLNGVTQGTHVIVPVDELVSIDRGLNQMMQAAYTVKLEGTKEWDIVAGGADIHGMSDKLRAMIRAAQPGTSD